MKKAFLLLLLFIFSATITIACSSSEPNRTVSTNNSDRVLNIYNWDSYINPEVIAQFEQDFKVEVNYKTYKGMEELYDNLNSNNSSYDLVFPANYTINDAVKNKLLSQLDNERIPNHKNIDPRFLNTATDPQNAYTVPYQWGTIGIGYNLQKTKGKIDSWQAIFDSKFKDKIYLVDDLRLIFGVTLIHLGLDPNTTNPQDIERAKQYLIEHKSNFAIVDGDDGQIFLDDGKVDLAVEYNGDIVQIMSENGAIDYTIPKEGSIIWMDVMAIPKNALHKELAQKFINYILEPKNAAKISNFTHYATPNQQALTNNLILSTDKKNPAIYPSQQILDKLVYLKDIGESIQLYEKAWQEFKTELKN
jgi:spermidine/putrescine transport system substrate-binding protein